MFKKQSSQSGNRSRSRATMMSCAINKKAVLVLLVLAVSIAGLSPAAAEENLLSGTRRHR